MIRFSGKDAEFSVVYHVPVEETLLGHMRGANAHVSVLLKVRTEEGPKYLSFQGELHRLPEGSPVRKEASGTRDGVDARQVEALVAENATLKRRVQELEKDKQISQLRHDPFTGLRTDAEGSIV